MRIPGATYFQAVLQILANTAFENRQQKIHQRMMVKKSKGKKLVLHAGRTWSWYEKRKRLRKLSRLARRKNRQVRARA